MKIILLGAPGAGKGTQADLLVKTLLIPKISTGDMLRLAVLEKSTLGMKAQEYMDRGELVPNELIIELIQERLLQQDCKNGFLFDGFPRNLEQAQALEHAEISVDLVVQIEVSDEEALNRLSGRRVHLASGRTYHIQYNPPKVDGSDDLTGEPLIQRTDDQEAVIRDRLSIYHQRTAPLCEFYQNKTVKYVKIDGAASIEAIQEQLIMALDALKVENK